MNAVADEDTDVWAIVQVMGHKTYAGRVSKDAVFALLRIDVPDTSTVAAFTKEVGKDAIFDITYVSQEIAERTAEALKARPIEVYAPELVTRAQYDQVQAEITLLRSQHALAEGRVVPRRPDLDGDPYGDG